MIGIGNIGQEATGQNDGLPPGLRSIGSSVKAPASLVGALGRIVSRCVMHGVAFPLGLLPLLLLLGVCGCRHVRGSATDSSVTETERRLRQTYVPCLDFKGVPLVDIGRCMSEQSVECAPREYSNAPPIVFEIPAAYLQEDVFSVTGEIIVVDVNLFGPQVPLLHMVRRICKATGFRYSIRSNCVVFEETQSSKSNAARRQTSPSATPTMSRPDRPPSPASSNTSPP